MDMPILTYKKLPKTRTPCMWRAGRNNIEAGDEMKADAVFEGGGIKGIGLVGALSLAEERGYEWVNVAGTSAGAIVAALVAAGYSVSEMKDILDGLDYTRFKDTSLLDRIPLVGPFLSLVFEKGIYEGDYLKDLLSELLRVKGVETFGDLILDEYREDEHYRFRLRVIASDISRGRLLALPQDISEYGIRPDDLNVALAVRMSMSMSIPFFFEPVKLRDMRRNQESYIVDGGLLSGFPVWLFDTKGPPEWPTFGFRLVNSVEELEVPRRIRGPISLLSALFSTMLEAHDARYIKEADFVRTILIPTLDVKATDFDISREKSQALFQSGRQAAEVFFEAWDFEDYVKKYRSPLDC